MGMTYDQFWHDDPRIAKFYREMDEIQRKRKNEELWLSGVYMAEAILSTVGNAFTKEKHTYPTEPKPITRDERKARQARDAKLREEKLKAKFVALALGVNAKKGAQHEQL